MSESFVHYAHMDKSDRSSLSFTGSDCLGHHALERTSYFHPTYQASYTASTVSHELRQGVLPAGDWRVGAPIQIHRSATTPQPGPSPFPFSQTPRAAPIPLYASGNSSPHFAYISGSIASSGANSLISQHDPHTVTMPTLVGHAKRGDELIDAHRCHYESSSAFNDNYIDEYYCPIQSPSIAVPMVPTIFGAGVSSYSDPVFLSGPALRRPVRHYTSTLQLPPSNSPSSLTPSESFDSEPYSSPSPPFSVGSHSSIVSPPETASDQIQPHPVITTASDQLYTLTVPLENIELPPIYSVEEIPLIHFFRCRWRDCRFWITSDKEAVKNHMTRTHNVVLRNANESACCEWVDCSSSPQRSGLVRHFQTHLLLKWLCSACKGGFTRPDSVVCHARRDSRCELAQAISHPSAAAYRIVTINENRTVTLTKILQP